jgi:cytochrome c oxidase subunit II
MPSPRSAGAPPREVEVRHRRAGRLRPATGRRAARLALLSTAVLGCGSPQNALDPRGPGAARIEELWWVLLGVAVVVSVGVTLLLLWATHRSRQRSRGAAVGQVNGRALVWIAGGIVTPAVVLALTVHSYRVGASVYTPLDPAGDVLTVEVVGHQFWWEVRYPEYGITTANEIHIPAGRPVRFLLSARRDPLVLGAAAPGQARHDSRPRAPALARGGRSRASIAGSARSTAAVSRPDGALGDRATAGEFEDWIESASRAAPEPADPLRPQRGREVFFAAGCASCHATRAWPAPRGARHARPRPRTHGEPTIDRGGHPAEQRREPRRWIRIPSGSSRACACRRRTCRRGAEALLATSRAWR